MRHAFAAPRRRRQYLLNTVYNEGTPAVAAYLIYRQIREDELREMYKADTGPFLVRYKPGKGPQEATTCWHTPGIAYAIKTPAQMCSGNYDTAVDYGYHSDNPRESFKFCPCEPVGQ